ncbi:putative TonB-dependent receptor [termite gut metagenome]|uniref:Putative TonB-dependent receptor n=1 Tax=termite gut metagenome TaxID=433724 RepID=A0A5J4RMU1_9ZZZZ
MKRKAAVLTGLFVIQTGVGFAYAQSTQSDSLKTITLQEVQVTSTRAAAKTPVAYTNVGKEEISGKNFGQDIPFLLFSTPSVLTTSDAGAGIGYTSIRVRGTDASRINVTANGIPMNDAESYSVYWVDMPDFASSLEDMQIQRGAGTSTNGAGAFGASINMRTQTTPVKAYTELLGSYGSFHTQKETVKVGSGLLAKHWAFDLRLSNIQSDGYRDRASSDLQSYFVQGGYYGEASTLRFLTFGGKEKTYHAWDGISKEMLDIDRRYNPNGEIERNGEVVGFYDDQTDNYRQTHYQLLFNHIFSPVWSLSAALHYTDGFGYYQEYKNRRTLVEYGLPSYETKETVVKKANLVRQKLIGSDFGGAIFSFNYKDEQLDASIGGGANRYTNDHYGKVIWIENYMGTLDPGHEYYRSDGKKDDANVYANRPEPTFTVSFCVWNEP